MGTDSPMSQDLELQDLLSTAREDNLDACRRYTALARWGALVGLSAAIEDLAMTFPPAVLHEVEDPSERVKLLTALTKVHNDLLKCETAAAGRAEVERTRINLLSDEEWNARAEDGSAPVS
jgi:hypothetical protein